MVIGSKALRFGGHDFGKVLNVALWSGLSATATVLVAQLQLVDWTKVLENPAYAAIAVSVVNTAAYLVKQIFVDTRKDVTPV